MNAIPPDVLAKDPGLTEWCILSFYRGSIAHGMHRPSSEPDSIDDKDVMAVCVPPLDYYFGLWRYGSRGTKEIKAGEWDIVVYEVRKMVSLLVKGNPNVLMALWLDDKYYIHKTKAGQMLLTWRWLFSGRHVYHSFTGYAHSQLKRMTHHAFEGYMGEKRKRLVERHGYDTKNAAHLVRLLRMGIEFLRDGRLQVTRPDAAELLAIKRGEWTIEQVKAEAERLFADAERAFAESELPTCVDRDAANDLCQRIVRLALAERGDL
jgi:predicted nucleotidyltransferase